MFHPSGTFCKEIEKLTPICNVEANELISTNSPKLVINREMTRFKSLCLTNIP